jgi:anti-sigma factor RsiW
VSHQSSEHLSAERMQAFLDRELSRRDAAVVEEHLGACARCSAELEGWRTLYEDLGSLGALQPELGFAERVMAGVTLPGAGEHVAQDVMHDFLDGILPARRAERVEAHLRACGPCTAEADAWLAVYRRLGELERFAPAEGFADRVMSAIELPQRAPLLTRLKARAAALVGASKPEHVPAGVLQDFVDGVLPARAVARVEAHLGSCAGCTSELQAWQSVAARLDTLERLSPREGFADGVMHAFLARRKARAVVPVSIPARLAAAARQLVPQSREAWAALSGVAVTPAVIAGLVAWAVFSHPTLTMGSLASFLFWQLADVSMALFGGLTSTLAQSVDLLGARSLLRAAAAAPMMVAVGVLGYSMLCALALRVLYKNLFVNRSLRDRYAHVSATS